MFNAGETWLSAIKNIHAGLIGRWTDLLSIDINILK